MQLAFLHLTTHHISFKVRRVGVTKVTIYNSNSKLIAANYNIFYFMIKRMHHDFIKRLYLVSR